MTIDNPRLQQLKSCLIAFNFPALWVKDKTTTTAMDLMLCYETPLVNLQIGTLAEYGTHEISVLTVVKTSGLLH